MNMAWPRNDLAHAREFLNVHDEGENPPNRAVMVANER